MKTEEIDKRIGMPDIDQEWAKFEKEVIAVPQPPKEEGIRDVPQTTKAASALLLRGLGGFKAAAIAGIIFLLSCAGIASAVIAIKNNSQPQQEKFEYKPLVEVVRQKFKGKFVTYYLVHYCEGVWIQPAGERGYIDEQFYQMSFPTDRTIMQLDGKPFDQKNLPRMRNSHLKKIEMKRQGDKLVANLITSFSGGVPNDVRGNVPREQTLFLFPNGMLGIVNHKAKVGDWIHYSITDWGPTHWDYSVHNEFEQSKKKLDLKVFIYASTETSQKYIDRSESLMKELGIKNYTITRDIPIYHKTDNEWREWATKQKREHPQYDWKHLFNILADEGVDGTDLHDKWHIVKEVYGVK